MLKIGIIGVGTVGQSVCNILEQNEDIITARAGVQLKVVKGVVQNLDKKRDVNIPLTTKTDDILNDKGIDIVVELMGGVEKPFMVVKKAIQNNKSIVTANKALLAYHRFELQKLAKDVSFEYEASVAGGIPIINALKDGLSANKIESLKGIMNGTCNYMLGKMIDDGVAYNDVLKEAQELGYAEADPTFDVGGFDAGHKLLILASIAYNIDASPEDILIEGIEDICDADIEFAKEFDYAIKLLGIAKANDNKVELRVHTALVPNNQLIAKVDGVMNAISVVGNKVGETLYYGAGAGGDATASAVVADIIKIAREQKPNPMLGYSKELTNKYTLASKDDIQTKYYLRLKVDDKKGILAQVSQILGKNNISIASMLQKPYDHTFANLLLSTHTAKEKDIKTALDQMLEQELILAKPMMIRIED